MSHTHICVAMKSTQSTHHAALKFVIGALLAVGVLLMFALSLHVF